MWWAGTNAHIYLGQTEAAVWSPRAADRGVQQIVFNSASRGWEQCIDRLWQLDPYPRRQSLTLSLSGALARPFIMPPIAHLQRWSEAVTLAQGLAAEATGIDGECEVWCEDWHPDHPSLIVAFNRAMRDRLESVARDRRVRLRLIRPWWVLALAHAIAETGGNVELLAIDENDALTLIGSDAQGFSLASTLVPRPSAEQIHASLTRSMLTAQVPPSKVSRVSMRHPGVNRDQGTMKKAIEPFGILREPMS